MSGDRPHSPPLVAHAPTRVDKAHLNLLHDLTFEMAMALNAADLGEPVCSQAALICAEIASQHCATAHQTDLIDH